MADFNLMADIQGNFQDIKRQARGETLQFDVQGTGGGQAAGGGAAAAGGATAARGAGILGTLGWIGGLIAIIITALEPLGAIVKILTLFLVPVMMGLMPVLTMIIKFLTQALQWWMSLNIEEKLGGFLERVMADLKRTIQDALPSWIPGIPDRQGAQRRNEGQGAAFATGMALTGNPIGLGLLGMRATNQAMNFVGSLFGGDEEGRKTEINVQGITDTSTARAIQRFNEELKEDSNG